MKGSLLNTISINGFSNTQKYKYQSIVIKAGSGNKKAFHLRCYIKNYMESRPDKKDEIIKRNAIIVTIITAIIAIGILALVLINRLTNGS